MEVRMTLTALWMTMTKNKSINNAEEHFNECGGDQGCHSMPLGVLKGCSLGNNHTAPQSVNWLVSVWSSPAWERTDKRELKTVIHAKFCAQVFIAAPFLTAQHANNLSFYQLINKLKSSYRATKWHITECYHGKERNTEEHFKALCKVKRAGCRFILCGSTYLEHSDWAKPYREKSQHPPREGERERRQWSVTARGHLCPDVIVILVAQLVSALKSWDRTLKKVNFIVCELYSLMDQSRGKEDGNILKKDSEVKLEPSLNWLELKKTCLISTEKKGTNWMVTFQKITAQLYNWPHTLH